VHPLSRASVVSLMRYMVFGLDPSGIAQAAYFMECLDDDEAKLRAQPLLEAHPTIEVWNSSVRIARLMRPGENNETLIAEDAARDGSATANNSEVSHAS
jgi:hypothetical protein